LVVHEAKDERSLTINDEGMSVLVQLAVIGPPRVGWGWKHRGHELGRQFINHLRFGRTIYHWATASSEPQADIITVTALQLPQTHIARGDLAIGGLVVVLIGIRRVQPRGAQIAEVGVAPGAYHVIAAMSLLCGSTARRTGAGVQLEVLERSLLLLRELGPIALGGAEDKFAVPCLEASAAERKPAVLAYRQSLRRARGPFSLVFLVRLFLVRPRIGVLFRL
jgi:hypothetical protein